MKRIDYLRQAVRPIRLPFAAPGAKLRRTLAVFGLTAVAISATAAAEAGRLAGLQRTGTALTEQLHRADADAADARALQRELARLQGIARRVAATRRSGPDGANDVAALGNRLPSNVWLTSLRRAPDTVSLEGRSAQLEAVAATMRALARAPQVVEARLVSAHDDTLHGGVAYAIAVDRRP